MAKVKLVSVEDGIGTTTFRTTAASFAQVNGDTEAYFVSVNGYRIWLRRLAAHLEGKGNLEHLKHLETIEIARGLAGSDLVGLFSSSAHAELTKKITHRLRDLDPSVFILWAGVHPARNPEDAIGAEVDAICTVDRQSAYCEFFNQFLASGDVVAVDNFWFRTPAGVRRNPGRPLNPDDPGDEASRPLRPATEKVYRSGKGFVVVGDRRRRRLPRPGRSPVRVPG